MQERLSHVFSYIDTCSLDTEMFFLQSLSVSDSIDVGTAQTAKHPHLRNLGTSLHLGSKP